jgi:hypothetical protein
MKMGFDIGAFLSGKSLIISKKLILYFCPPKVTRQKKYGLNLQEHLPAGCLISLISSVNLFVKVLN